MGKNPTPQKGSKKGSKLKKEFGSKAPYET